MTGDEYDDDGCRCGSGAGPVRWRCDGCGQVSYDDAAPGDLRRRYANVCAALEDARRAVDAANRVGETEQERAVEQAFIQRARPGHVQLTIWPRWNPMAGIYSLACSCGWRSATRGSEQAAHDEFARHAAGKGPAEVWKHCRWREPHLAVPRDGSHYIQPGTGATEAACVTCGEAVVLVAGGETGDRQ